MEVLRLVLQAVHVNRKGPVRTQPRSVPVHGSNAWPNVGRRGSLHEPSPRCIHLWWGEAPTSRRGACTLRLARTLAPPACSWSQCLVERTWSLSMNRRPSGCFGLEDEIVFPGQFLQQILFGLD